MSQSMVSQNEDIDMAQAPSVAGTEGVDSGTNILLDAGSQSATPLPILEEFESNTSTSSSAPKKGVPARSTRPIATARKNSSKPKTPTTPGNSILFATDPPPNVPPHPFNTFFEKAVRGDPTQLKFEGDAALREGSRLKNELDSAQQQVLDLLAQIQTNKTAADKKITNLEDECESLRETCGILQTQDGTWKNSFDTMKRRVNEDTEELARRNDRLDEYEEAAERQKAKHARALKQLNADKDEAERQCQRAERKLAEVENDLADARQEIQELQDEVNGHETQDSEHSIGEQRSPSETAAKEILSVLLHNLQDRIRDSDEDKTVQDNHIEELDLEILARDAAIQSKDAEIRSKDAEIQELWARIETTAASNGASGDQSTALQLNPQSAELQFALDPTASVWDPSASQQSTIDPSLLQTQSQWKYTTDLPLVNSGPIQQPQGQIWNSLTQELVPLQPPQQPNVLSQDTTYEGSPQQWRDPNALAFDFGKWANASSGSDQVMTDAGPALSTGPVLPLDPLDYINSLQKENERLQLDNFQYDSLLKEYQGRYGFLTPAIETQPNSILTVHIDPHQTSRDEHPGMFETTEDQDGQGEMPASNVQQQFEQTEEQLQITQDAHEHEQTALRTQLKEAQGATAAANDRESAIRRELDQVMQQQAGEMATLRSQLQQAQEEMATLRSQLQKAQEATAAANHRGSAVRRELDQVTQQQAGEMATLRSQLQKAQEATAAANDRGSAVRRELDHVTQQQAGELAALRTQLKKAQGATAAANDSESAIRRELDQVTQQQAGEMAALQVQLQGAVAAAEAAQTAMETRSAPESSFQTWVKRFHHAAIAAILFALLYLIVYCTVAYVFNLPGGIWHKSPTSPYPAPRFHVNKALWLRANEYTRGTIISLRAAGLRTYGEAWFGLSTYQGSKFVYDLEQWLKVDRGLLG